MLHLTSNAGTNRCPLNPVTVRFAAGEIQFVKQSGCVLIGLTSRLFDLEGYPQRSRVHDHHLERRSPLGRGTRHVAGQDARVAGRRRRMTLGNKAGRSMSQC
jgi:hypothetical protein